MCTYIIHTCLTITDYSDGDYLRSYKHTELQVEKNDKYVPNNRDYDTADYFRKWTNSITTPDTALKKAFKTETFVISTAATVEKPSVYFLFLRNICKISASCTSQKDLKKIKIKNNKAKITYLLNSLFPLFLWVRNMKAHLPTFRKLSINFIKEFLHLPHWGRNQKFYGNHENFTAIRHTAISMEKTIWPSYYVSQNFKLIQFVKALEIAAYSVYNMGIWTGVSYLDDTSSLRNTSSQRFQYCTISIYTYIHTHFLFWMLMSIFSTRHQNWDHAC